MNHRIYILAGLSLLSWAAIAVPKTGHYKSIDGKQKSESVRLSTLTDAYGNVDTSAEQGTPEEPEEAQQQEDALEDIYGTLTVTNVAGGVMITLPKAEKVELYNFLGQQVHAEYAQKVYIPAPAGLYILHIGQSTKKIAIQ